VASAVIEAAELLLELGTPAEHML